MVNSKMYRVLLTQEVFDKYFEDVDFTCETYKAEAMNTTTEYFEMREKVIANLERLTDAELDEILAAQVATYAGRG